MIFRIDSRTEKNVLISLDLSDNNGEMFPISIWEFFSFSVIRFRFVISSSAKGQAV